MRTNDRILFRLLAQDNGSDDVTMWEVHPQYSGLTVNYAKGDDEMYYSRTMDGEITFCGDEFDIIHRRSVYTKFTLVIFDKQESGATPKEVLRGTFRKSDCTTDVDHRTVRVKLKVDDEYDNIIEGRGDEHELTRMNLTKHSVDVELGPCYQVYEMGAEEYINCVRGSFNALTMPTVCDLASEMATAMLGADADTNDLEDYEVRIFYMPLCMKLTVTAGSYLGYTFSTAATTPSTIAWEPGTTPPMAGIRWLHADINTYVSHRDLLYTTVQCVENSDLHLIVCIDEDDYDVYLIINDSSLRSDIDAIYAASFSNSIRLSYLQTGSTFGTVTGETLSGRFKYLYVRALCVNEPTSIEDYNNLYEINHEIDTIAGLNYDWTMLFSLCARWGDFSYYDACRWMFRNWSYLVSSTNFSTEDQGYGQNDNGDYYAPPTYNTNFYPIMQDLWDEGHSLWIAGGNFITQSESRLVKGLSTYYPLPAATHTVDDFYALGDVIAALVDKCDHNVTFESNADHSRFLFDTTNPVSGQAQGPILITQKSNILNYAYDYAAWKAPVTLEQVFTFLRNAMNCYYDIYEDESGNKHLRIEHVSYYLNGYSYGSSSLKAIDLRTQYYNDGKTPLTFNSRHWSYGDYEKPSRIDFAWMDTQSEPFAGFPIHVPDLYRLTNNHSVRERFVDWFSTDVDFLVSVPGECSSDGFCAVMTDSNGIVMTGEVSCGGQTYGVQNYTLSFAYLHKYYMAYNLYSKYVTMNGTDDLVEVRYRAQMRESELAIPLPNNMGINPHYVVRTEVGLGTIEKMAIDLSDMTVELTIKYDIES